MCGACGIGSERGLAGIGAYIEDGSPPASGEGGRPVAEGLPPFFRDCGSQLEVAEGYGARRTAIPPSPLARKKRAWPGELKKRNERTYWRVGPKGGGKRKLFSRRI